MISIAQEIPTGPEHIERPIFLPVPERIAPYLEHLKEQEIEAQIRSVEGRRQLHGDLLQKSEEIRRDHNGSFHPELLEMQLEAAGEALAANDRYMEQLQEPEKQTILRRAWETVKKFPRNHPVVAAILAAGVVAGSVAAGFYFTGNWEMLLKAVGMTHLWGAEGAEGAAEAVGTIIEEGGGIPDYFPGPTGPQKF